MICNYWRLLLTRFWAALAILQAVKNLLSLIPQIKQVVDGYGVICFTLIVMVSLLYSFYVLCSKRKSLSLKLNKRTTLNVFYGDLFAQEGMKVIPVNEYFDTHLGDGIVAPNTVHGLFLKKYQGQISRLNNLLRKQLEKQTPVQGLHRERVMVSGLPQIPYPLGTCVRIDLDNKKYLLVAVTRFNENEHVDINLREYPIVIQKLFYSIEQLCDANPVYLPLIGGGQAGVKLSKMQLLNTIIRAGQNSEVSIVNGVNIVLYGDDAKNEINLNLIKHLYECWKGL